MEAAPLPQIVAPSHKRSVKLFISDVRGGVEKGGLFTVDRYCPENYMSDGYVPPNLNFSQCFLSTNTRSLSSGGPSMRKFFSKKSSKKITSPVVGGVTFRPHSLKHVFSSHCVLGSDMNFPYMRKKPIFQWIQPVTGFPGNSVFLAPSMVEGLISLTVSYPDKITTVKNGNTAFEKGFRTEIGHSSMGCCHVVRVVTSALNPSSPTCNLITAYPTHHFSPSGLE